MLTITFWLSMPAKPRRQPILSSKRFAQHFREAIRGGCRLFWTTAIKFQLKIMKYARFQFAVVVFLLAAGLSGNGQAQPRQHRQMSGSEIRKIDFRNFTYHSTLCAQELSRDGVGETVRVRNGQFKNA